MGVYLYLGDDQQHIFSKTAIDFKELGSFKSIHNCVETSGECYVYFSRGVHKIKKKAEQMACFNALQMLK